MVWMSKNEEDECNAADLPLRDERLTLGKDRLNRDRIRMLNQDSMSFRMSNLLDDPIDLSEYDGKQLDQTPANDLKNREADLCMNSTVESTSCSFKKDEVFKSCLELSALAMQRKMRLISQIRFLSRDSGKQRRCKSSLSRDLQLAGVTLQKSDLDLEHNAQTSRQSGQQGSDESTGCDNLEQQTAALLKGVEISLCRNLLHAGMGSVAARGFLESTEQIATPRGGKESPRKQSQRTNVPSTGQIESLKLKEGQNCSDFHFFHSSTRGAKGLMFLVKSGAVGWKGLDPLGIARLFCAIKLLFLSARAIVQAYLTKSFLFNLKQDGKSLPPGPVVISPDGLFPSLYREVIRRAPHEFKIACLEDIKALFPPDYNPFYAGFE
ncbi:hypothetical protein HAX54_024918 [Datura stramonium]|uniref:LNS2/PITP domain-containing protein n=1 Tax=Datura stramonium TaxID=4076 RepID=A0ABS8V0J5_DATST|nr:hypothetical protein [Datura stramonium]